MQDGNENEDYDKCKQIVSHIAVVNDCAERAVQLGSQIITSMK